MKAIVGVFILVVAVSGAPAPAAKQQYLYLTPQAQLQLQPAFKLQQPILQPIYQLGSFAPQKDQLYLYPNLQLVDGKQSGPDFVTLIQSVFGLGVPSNPFINNTAAKIEFEKDAETFPVQPAIPVAAPAPPTFLHLPIDGEQKFYIVGGQPQFFGNFDGLQAPVISLQPLQQVKSGRSADTSIEADNAEQQLDQLPAETQEAVLRVQQVNEQVEEIAPVQLRSVIEAVQPVSVVEQVVDAEVVAESEARSQSSIASAQNLPEAEIVEAKESVKADLKEDDDPSVAQARPTAIAFAGKGGLAQAAPVGMAFVSRGGLALASPQATSLAGDFLDDEEKRDDSSKKE